MRQAEALAILQSGSERLPDGCSRVLAMTYVLNEFVRRPVPKVRRCR